MREVSRSNNNVRAARDDRNKEPNQSSLDVTYQIQTRVDIEIIPLATQTPLIQHGHRPPTLTDASGTWTLPQEHEKLIRSTQRKMPRLIVQTKRKYKTKDMKNKVDEETKSDEESKHKYRMPMYLS